jgi:hypothetical protein
MPLALFLPSFNSLPSFLPSKLPLPKPNLLNHHIPLTSPASSIQLQHMARTTTCFDLLFIHPSIPYPKTPPSLWNFLSQNTLSNTPQAISKGHSCYTSVSPRPCLPSGYHQTHPVFQTAKPHHSIDVRVVARLFPEQSMHSTILAI